MRIDPTLVKQHARKVCAFCVPLWRHMVTVGIAAAGQGGSSSSSSNSRVSLTPSQVKLGLAEFAAKDPTFKAYLEVPENKNLPRHIQTLLMLLTPTDDPLTIEADIVTSRVLGIVMQGKRSTSLNNMLSAARSAFRLLFGRCLLPGIECPPTTVRVNSETLRIHLQSPLPDGAVTEFGHALQTRGSLAREPQGVIRAFETLQLHLLWAWEQLLSGLADLRKWGPPDFIPSRALDQINRWTMVIQAWLFRGLVDLGRPSDISLYHLGNFQLVLPDDRATPLAAVVLNSLQQGGHSSMDEVLEAFRAAGAVLEIHAPKCKQSEAKRRKNGNQSIDWVVLRKPLLDPALAVLCPTRTVAFCMAASWWARGAVSARLLGVMRSNSRARAPPKRHQQPDYQASLPTGAAKVPTAGDMHSYIPALYLLQAVQQGSSSTSDTEESSADEGSGSDGEVEEAPTSTISTAAPATQPQYWLSHAKPRKGSHARVLLKLRRLSGYDQRHSLQKDALQCGIPLQLSAKLAAHTVEEAQRYSCNCNYELCDTTTSPLKLASPEWTQRDPVPPVLSPHSTLDGIPVDLDLFSSRASNQAVAPTAAAVDSRLSAILNSASMQHSITQMTAFLNRFVNLPNLNALLHGPVLGQDCSTDEVLPVQQLRQFPGVMHLRSADSSVQGVLTRLPRISAAGLAAPAAHRLVQPELHEIYLSLAAGIEDLAADLKGGVAVQQENSSPAHRPQLRLLHHSQVAFGRLDLAWQLAEQQQQQQQHVSISQQQAAEAEPDA